MCGLPYVFDIHDQYSVAVNAFTCPELSSLQWKKFYSSITDTTGGPTLIDGHKSGASPEKKNTGQNTDKGY